MHDVDGPDVKPHTVVTFIVLEEQRLVVTTVHFHGDTRAMPAHGGVINVREGVAALLKAEPCPSHYEWNHAIPMAHCGEEE